MENFTRENEGAMYYGDIHFGSELQLPKAWLAQERPKQIRCRFLNENLQILEP